MASVEFKRDYRMLDAELCMFASDLCVRLSRDLDDVSVFGINDSLINDLRNLGDEFETFPSDDAYLGDMMLATQTKNQIAEQLRETIRNMALRVQLKWGTSSPQYKSLGALSVSKVSDDVLLGSANKILGRMTGYLSELSSTGLTQSDLDNYADQISSFESALNDYASAIELRDSKTRERIMKGNELYKYVVNYCEIGKRVYEKTNYAKYNDYIIYTNVSPGSLTAPQNFMFNPLSYEFTWNAVNNATSYELQSSSDGINYTEYWADSGTSCSYEESPNIKMYYKIRARNSNGFGPFSMVIQYNFAPPLIPPDNFRYNSDTFYFLWNEVPNAEYYEFQFRLLSDSNWNSLSAGTNTNFYHADPPGEYLARVRAVNGNNYGPWSITLEYSVGINN